VVISCNKASVTHEGIVDHYPLAGHRILDCRRSPTTARRAL